MATRNMMVTRMSFTTAGADYLFTKANDIASDTARKIVDGIKEDIQANWSTHSPSDPYTSPAVVTGFLDNQIKRERRDSRGRFAVFGNAVTWILRVEAEYGLALEFGNPAHGLIERPYFYPAVFRAEDQLGIQLNVELKSEIMRANALTKAKFLSRRGL